MTSPWGSAILTQLADGIQENPRKALILPRACGQQLQMTLVKFASFAILESSLVMNVQASGLALSKAAHKNHEDDVFTLFSLIIGYVLGILTAAKAYQTAKELKDGIFSVNVEAALPRNMTKLGFKEGEQLNDMLDAFRVGDMTNDGVWAKVACMKYVTKWEFSRSACMETSADYTMSIHAQKTATRLWQAFQILVIIYMILLFRAAIQAYFSIVCPQGLHNMFVGCVDLSDFS